MKIKSIEHYDLLASLFSYPDEKLRIDSEAAHRLLESKYISASKFFNEFYLFSKSISLIKWQEIYTRTFDVQAITTLDLGYVLFGDDYKRGELLVNLSKEHKNYNIDCGSELGDHLPNVLRLLTQLTDDDLKTDLIYLIIKPALHKISAEFDIDKIDKKNSVYKKHQETLIEPANNFGLIYQQLLMALIDVLQTDFPDSKFKFDNEKTFTKEITNEIEIES
ncbi:MAG: hypothetical protein IT276_07790 [Ignavibacteriaceae bacterium]|nr:hypothetical protein [Ignavibacteriaceae bacterium]HRQ54042.1 hypothetical protein [Ignavibacteriaceae bacterium]